jgi:hypothetical protein
VLKLPTWRDSCIPREEFKITKNLPKSRIRKVKDNIGRDKMEWKEDMVKQVFMPHDADEAL